MAARKTSEAGLTELRERWERSPGSHLFLQLAEEYRRRGEFDEAVAVLRKGILTNPSLAAEVSLGRSLLEGGDALGAQAHLQNAVQRDPTQMVAYRHLVEVCIQLEDGGEAERCLDIYRQLNSRDPDLPVLEERIERLQSTPPSIDHEAKDSSPVKEEIVAANPLPVEVSDLSVVWKAEEENIPAVTEAPKKPPLGTFEKAVVAGRMENPSAYSADNTLQPPAATGPDQEQQPRHDVAIMPPHSSSSGFAGTFMDDDDDSRLFFLEPTPSQTFDLFSLPSRPLSWKSLPPRGLPDAQPVAGRGEVGVTATLGQIYLSQGHVEEAKRIYRALDEPDRGGLVRPLATDTSTDGDPNTDEVIGDPDFGSDPVSDEAGAAVTLGTRDGRKPASGGLDQFVEPSAMHALESFERRRVLLKAYLKRIIQAKSNSHVS